METVICYLTSIMKKQKQKTTWPMESLQQINTQLLACYSAIKKLKINTFWASNHPPDILLSASRPQVEELGI